MLQWSIYQGALDPVQGSEQAGSRPVLIVSRESINRSLGIVAVLPLTALKPGRRIYPTEVLLPSTIAGLPVDSLVLAHQIRVVAKSRLGRLGGSLTDEPLQEKIRSAMRLYLDLEGIPGGGGHG